MSISPIMLTCFDSGLLTDDGTVIFGAEIDDVFTEDVDLEAVVVVGVVSFAEEEVPLFVNEPELEDSDIRADILGILQSILGILMSGMDIIGILGLDGDPDDDDDDEEEEEDLVDDGRSNIEPDIFGLSSISSSSFFLSDSLLKAFISTPINPFCFSFGSLASFSFFA